MRSRSGAGVTSSPGLRVTTTAIDPEPWNIPGSGRLDWKCKLSHDLRAMESLRSPVGRDVTMHRNRAATFVVFVIALVTTHRESLATIASAQSVPMPNAAAAQPVPPDGLRITLLGTGVGPPVNLPAVWGEYARGGRRQATLVRLRPGCDHPPRTGRYSSRCDRPIVSDASAFRSRDADSGFAPRRVGRADGTQGAARGLGTGRHARDDERTQSVRLRHSHPPGRGRKTRAPASRSRATTSAKASCSTRTA